MGGQCVARGAKEGEVMQEGNYGRGKIMRVELLALRHGRAM